MISATKRSLFKSIAIILCGTVTARIAMLLYRYICMRQLSMADYGVLTLLISLFVTLVPLAHFSCGNALSKFLSEIRLGEEKRNKILISNALIIGIIGSILAAGIMFFFLWNRKLIFLNYSSLFPTLIICFLLHSFLFIFGGAFKGFFKMKSSAVIDGSIGISKAVFIAGFTIFGYLSLKTAFLSYTFGPLVPFLILCFVSVPLLKRESISFRVFDKRAFLKIFRFSRNMTLATVITGFFSYFPNWRLSLISFDNVAIYGGGVLLYSALQFVFSSYVTTIVPYISRHVSNGRLIKMPQNRVFLKLYIPIILLIILLKVTSLDKSALLFLHLDEYAGSLLIFYILLLSAPLDLLFGTYSGILQGTGNVGALLSITKWGLLFHVFVIVVLGFYGIVGIAIGRILTFLFLAILGFQTIRRLGLIR